MTFAEDEAEAWRQLRWCLLALVCLIAALVVLMNLQ